MQAAVITDEISQNFDHALSVMAEFGVPNAELRNVYGTYIVDADADLLNKVEADLKRRGAKVVCVDTPFYKCDLDAPKAGAGATHNANERTLADQQTLLLHAMDLAKRFETPFLRIFSFWKRGGLTPDIEERIADALVRPCELAERAGITLLLENEHACYLGTAAETVRVIERVGSPALKLVYDPGNSFFAGEQPFPAGYEAARAFTAHVHIKDAKVNADGMPVFCKVGDGEIDYAGLFAAMKADAYDGYIALETHYKGEDGDAESASRESLRGMMELMGLK
ncbi:MAG: sugar phosphate isomerase/epimerase [Armatimonadetes bacterium]|nr:sugar phosphate isomerase/epimerase [Armatimonadota bacterium]